MSASPIDNLLIERVRAGESEAWEEVIARFAGRLLAYVESRTGNRTAAEDVVQETFIGFLTSLPNYDARQPLEGYLFAIAAHKLTDHLRREGRRPALPLAPGGSEGSSWDPPGRDSAGQQHRAERGAQDAGGGVAGSGGPGATCRLAPPRRLGEDPLRGAALRPRLAEQRGGGAVGHFRADGGQPQVRVPRQLRNGVRDQGLPEEVFPELYEKEG